MQDPSLPLCLSLPCPLDPWQPQPAETPFLCKLSFSRSELKVKGDRKGKGWRIPELPQHLGIDKKGFFILSDFPHLPPEL